MDRSFTENRKTMQGGGDARAGFSLFERALVLAYRVGDAQAVSALLARRLRYLRRQDAVNRLDRFRGPGL